MDTTQDYQRKEVSITMDDSTIMVIAFPDGGEESKRKMETIMRIVSGGSESVLTMDLTELDENSTFRVADKED